MSSTRSEPPPTSSRGGHRGRGDCGSSRATTCSPSRVAGPPSASCRASASTSASRSIRGRNGGMVRPSASNSSVLQPAPSPAVTRSPPTSSASWLNPRSSSAGCSQAEFITTVCSSSRSVSPATAASVVTGSQPGSACSARLRPGWVANRWSDTLTPVAPASTSSATASRNRARSAVAASSVSSTKTFTAGPVPRSRLRERSSRAVGSPESAARAKRWPGTPTRFGRPPRRRS